MTTTASPVQFTQAEIHALLLCIESAEVLNWYDADKSADALTAEHKLKLTYLANREVSTD